MHVALGSGSKMREKLRGSWDGRWGSWADSSRRPTGGSSRTEALVTTGLAKDTLAGQGDFQKLPQHSAGTQPSAPPPTVPLTLPPSSAAT